MNRQLYELLTPDEFHAKFSQLTGPSSLFKKLEEKEIKPSTLINENNKRLLTPLKEAIKEPVSSFSQLSQLLQKRIKAKLEPDPGLPADQLQSLMAVVISELGSSWSEVRCLAPDPFLSNQQNKHVERLLAMEVINIAEDLYFGTIDKAKELNDRGVFSSYANSSRLKAQLALEANQSFDIVKIHRRLATALKQSSQMGRLPSESSEYASRQPTAVTNSKSKKTGKNKRGILVVSPRLTREEKDKKKRESDLKQLETQMPNFSLENVEKTYGIYSYDLYQRVKQGQEETDVDTCNDDDKCDDDRILLSRADRRYQSLPNLIVGESLLDELGIVEQKEGYRRTSVDKLEINLACCGIKCPSDSGGTHLESRTGEDSNFLSDDLNRLVATHEASKKKQFSLSEQDQELPPLLQALNYHSTKKRKVPLNNDLDNDLGVDESEACSTTASSVDNNDYIDRAKVSSVGEEDKRHIQPATVSTRIPDKGIVRTSDVRVSNRVNKSDVTLKSYPTVYNDLINEIDPATVKWLDRNLYIGDEIREVYEEVIKTVGTDHLLFDKDPFVETHASKVDFSHVVHSSILMGNKSDKVINPSLHRDIPPPWGKHGIEKWKNSPMFGELGRQDILNMGAQALVEITGKATKSYNHWLAWWRSTITIDDYFKFLSTQDNDFLSLSYHLYESDDGSSDEEAENERQPNARELELRRAREKKFVEIRKLKEEFSAGFWNANSVLIGGLGKYPDITDEELGIDMTSEPSTTSPEQDGRKTGDTSITNEVSSPLSLQDRLDRVWTLLCMPDALRLDMAIKYSSEIYIDKLEEVLIQWETAVKLVLSRESLITKLEDFERLASDPNRFFVKGGAGSAGSRIKEAKTRRQFHHNLDNNEVRVKKVVTAIHESFGDIVTFQGRPYFEKMASDRTEMLYWLQQERRQSALNVAQKTMELRFAEIPPLSVHQVL